MSKTVQGNLDARQIKAASRQGDSDVVLTWEGAPSPTAGTPLIVGPTGGATEGSGAIKATIGITVDGGNAAPTTGVKGYVQLPFAGTIVGWAAIADQAGLMTMDIDRHASSAPPSAPETPNTTTDKISASAPVTLGTGSPLVSAQSQAVASAGVSTWSTALAQWDVIGFNLTSASTLHRVIVEIYVDRTL